MQLKIIEVSRSLVISRANFISDVIYRQTIRPSVIIISICFVPWTRARRQRHHPIWISYRSANQYVKRIFRRVSIFLISTRDKMFFRYKKQMNIKYSDHICRQWYDIQSRRNSKKKLNHSFLNLQISFSLIYGFPAIAKVNDLVYISQWILT